MAGPTNVAAVPATRHKMEWLWVRGHAGDVMNEWVDVLATEARGRICLRRLPRHWRLKVRSVAA
jgi:ribonuclease HI